MFISLYIFYVPKIKFFRDKGNFIDHQYKKSNSIRKIRSPRCGMINANEKTLYIYFWFITTKLIS